MVFKLDASLTFPDPVLADDDGWLAVGGDLSAPRLLLAYENGIFPWYSEGEPICWYSPHKRCVIFPMQMVISKSMQRIISKKTFDIRVDTAFQQVIAHCGKVPRAGQGGTWISADMQKAYLDLHQKGFAHSVEAWQDNVLVGGFYGVVINKVFCGESMFSNVSNASKAALAWLCREGDFTMVDCQLPSAHLMSLGAVVINRNAYMQILRTQG